MHHRAPNSPVVSFGGDTDVRPGDRGAPAHRGRDLECCLRRVLAALHLWRLEGRFRRTVAAGALHPTVDGPPATASADDLLAYAAGSDCDDAAPLRQSRDVDIGQPISLETPDPRARRNGRRATTMRPAAATPRAIPMRCCRSSPRLRTPLLDQARRAATEVALSAGAEVRQTQGEEPGDAAGPVVHLRHLLTAACIALDRMMDDLGQPGDTGGKARKS